MSTKKFKCDQCKVGPCFLEFDGNTEINISATTCNNIVYVPVWEEVKEEGFCKMPDSCGACPLETMRCPSHTYGCFSCVDVWKKISNLLTTKNVRYFVGVMGVFECEVMREKYIEINNSTPRKNQIEPRGYTIGSFYGRVE